MVPPMEALAAAAQLDPLGPVKTVVLQFLLKDLAEVVPVAMLLRLAKTVICPLAAKAVMADTAIMVLAEVKVGPVRVALEQHRVPEVQEVLEPPAV